MLEADMYQVELLVRLKIPDVTALTASNSLRRRMGYGQTLAELKRADYYLFEVEAASADGAVATVRNIAERTILFVNPNKHAFDVLLKGEQPESKTEAGTFDVAVLVRDVDGDKGPGLCNALAKMGYGDAVRSVQAQTMWAMKIHAKNAEAARKIAEEIAVTHNRKQGLLVNPHYQEYSIRA
jgi:phosphoribosylformylglycinamidine (FGAM) synthase PurS component